MNQLLFFSAQKVCAQFVESPVAMRDGVLGLLRKFTVSLLEPVGEENRVPSEFASSSWSDDRSLGDALEQDDFRVLAFGVSEGADRLS